MDKDTAKMLVILIERFKQQEELLMIVTKVVCTGFKNVWDLTQLRARIKDLPEGPEKDAVAQRVHDLEKNVSAGVDLNLLNTFAARVETDHERLEAAIATFKKLLGE